MHIQLMRKMAVYFCLFIILTCSEAFSIFALYKCLFIIIIMILLFLFNVHTLTKDHSFTMLRPFIKNFLYFYTLNMIRLTTKYTFSPFFFFFSELTSSTKLHLILSHHHFLLLSSCLIFPAFSTLHSRRKCFNIYQNYKFHSVCSNDT